MFEDIQKIISKTKKSSVEDVKSFTDWYEGVITLKECKEQFYLHNNVDLENTYISDDLFRSWLKSLGWN